MSADFTKMLGKSCNATHQVEAAIKRIYPDAPICVDGELSAEEEAVIRRYQQERGLPTHNPICKKTYETLAADMATHPIIRELAKPGEAPMETLQRLTILNRMGMCDTMLQGFNRCVTDGCEGRIEGPMDTPGMEKTENEPPEAP